MRSRLSLFVVVSVVAAAVASTAGAQSAANGHHLTAIPVAAQPPEPSTFVLMLLGLTLTAVVNRSAIRKR